MRKSRIITIASQKGGTGKTTTVLNLSASLAELGKKVLMLDLDPQANLSTGAGLDIEKQKYTIYEVLLNPNHGLEIALIKSPILGLDLIPSKLDLAGLEYELSNKQGREWILKKVMKKVVGQYDFVFIDTPPSLGIFTQNALMASQEVLVAMQVHVYSFRALKQLQKIIDLIKKQNEALHISGVVCTMFDKRNNLSKVIHETIQKELGNLVFETIIPQNIDLAEAPAAGKPINVYAQNSAGCKAYRALAKEIL